MIRPVPLAQGLAAAPQIQGRGQQERAEGQAGLAEVDGVPGGDEGDGPGQGHVEPGDARDQADDPARECSALELDWPPPQEGGTEPVEGQRAHPAASPMIVVYIGIRVHGSWARRAFRHH